MKLNIPVDFGDTVYKVGISEHGMPYSMKFTVATIELSASTLEPGGLEGLVTFSNGAHGTIWLTDKTGYDGGFLGKRGSTLVTTDEEEAQNWYDFLIGVKRRFAASEVRDADAWDKLLKEMHSGTPKYADVDPAVIDSVKQSEYAKQWLENWKNGPKNDE